MISNETTHLSKECSDVNNLIADRDDRPSHLSHTKFTQATQKLRLLWMVLGLRSIFFVVELGVGLISHSLSLLAGAGHLLSDLVALGLTLLATKLAQRPAVGQATFGYQRLEILVALLNGLALIAIALFIAWEAINRFQSPEPLLGLPMLMVAGLGFVINSLNIGLLHSDSYHDLNLRGAFLHVIADAASSVGVILAAVSVYYFNWLWADAVASLLVACLITLSAIPLVRDSLKVLMEYAPYDLDVAKVEAALSSLAGVRQVQKLHIWTITSGQVALCAQLAVESLSVQERDRLIFQLQNYLTQEFDIGESTVQIVAFDESDVVSVEGICN